MSFASTSHAPNNIAANGANGTAWQQKSKRAKIGSVIGTVLLLVLLGLRVVLPVLAHNDDKATKKVPAVKYEVVTTPTTPRQAAPPKRATNARPTSPAAKTASPSANSPKPSNTKTPPQPSARPAR